jgi:Rieske Fe-S protein
MGEAIDGVTIGCAARRAVLAGLTSAGVAVLAGCGGDDKSSDYAGGNYDTSKSSATPEWSSAPPSAEASSAPPAGPAPGGGAQAANLVKTSAVPVGGGVLASGLLVVQPQAGVFKAYDATCPHAGVTVDPPSNGTFTCPGHYSKFKVADGSRISGPATRGLKTVAVKVTSGWVVKA